LSPLVLVNLSVIVIHVVVAAGVRCGAVSHPPCSGDRHLRSLTVNRMYPACCRECYSHWHHCWGASYAHCVGGITLTVVE